MCFWFYSFVDNAIKAENKELFEINRGNFIAGISNDRKGYFPSLVDGTAGQRSPSISRPEEDGQEDVKPIVSWGITILSHIEEET